MAETQLAGTRIPRWTAPAAPPAGWSEADWPAGPELAAVLGALPSIPPATALLGAHLKVLAELSGERTVLTSYQPPGSQLAQRCAAAVDDGSWRQLLDAARRSSRDTAPADPAVETLLDLSAMDLRRPAADTGGDAPRDAAALHVSCRYLGGEPWLRLRYRHDVMTADFAGRIAGYYLSALRLMAAGPEAPHHAQSLVSDAELQSHLHVLAGRRVPLPEQLFVELFEDQARARPAAIAAMHNGRRWTYQELNERANQVADLLLSSGLAAEDVVAVCLSRDLDWLAAMLGVLKCGGVYLPIRPDFPPGRVLAQLQRSACRLALTAPGDAATLEQAIARSAGDGPALDCAAFPVQDAYLRSARGNPGVRIRPGQLAYIYFTSGSTGEPKGAMCEHAGLLNHLYTKVDDLGLTADDVVTQTASQCFDISLWQLAAPLLVGGCTQIVDTELQLDVGRFAGMLAAGGIQVIQIVPAYLEVMLSHLERHPVPLGDLRSVSVTGEALKTSLVRRWFACYPQISLVNAYGATEVSDDTMHAVLQGPPERDAAIVTVGRSLRNINTYVLNEHLQVAPLGAPGEIAFSGVCVGRGYINDPDRTAQAFVEDPYRPGTRLYRTGDFGRWLPEGTIEFLGRRDEQVKIRGFRIEIGEIENRLLQMPGVREAAVVIDGQTDQTRHLVAFFTGAAGLQPADLRDFLAAALPDYMVPSYLHQLDALPLTENGKVNKRQLITLAGELSQGVAVYEPPATPTEQRLAVAWAEILNVLVGRISRNDDFFKLGGTSLAAVRLVVKLDRLISLRQLVAHPVLADLAVVIDTAAASSGALLQQLSAVDAPAASLVCFPYAGGNAVNYQALAKELEPSRIAVYGVELPGHDVANADEALAGVAEIAGRVRAELTALPKPVLIWGHCAGAAAALELARLLEQDGPRAVRLFLGGALLADRAALQQEITHVSGLSNQQITSDLHRDSAYVELDLLKSERSDLVGMAFRHDVCTSNEYLIAAMDGPAERKLRTPVEVVVATDDPTTAGHDDRSRGWGRLAETVAVHELDEGGHYFIRSRPAALAELVAADLLAADVA